MKSFIQKVILYIFLSAFLSIIVLYGMSFIYWNKRIPIQKKKIVEKVEPGLSIVLGSSHAFYGINCSLIGDNYYNLASISQSLYEDFIILKYFKYKKIKSVILPISYFSNFSYLSNVTIIGEKIRVFDYIHAYNAMYPLEFRSIQGKYFLTEQIAKSLTEVISERGRNVNILDKYGCLFENINSHKFDISDSVKAFQRHNVNYFFKTRNPYLDSIISYCSKNNVRLNIVVFPFTKGYQNAIKRSNNEFEQFLISIKDFQFENLKFIDCRNLIPDREEIYFRDADHLSPLGRDSLSKYLKKVILN